MRDDNVEQILSLSGEGAPLPGFTIDGITVRGAYGRGSDTPAMQVEDIALTLRHCLLTDNRAVRDAGVVGFDTYLELDACAVVSNERLFGGAPIRCLHPDSTLLVTACTFEANHGGGGNGAISGSFAQLVIDDSVFKMNISEDGTGAVGVNATTARIRNCLFLANSGHDTGALGLYSRHDEPLLEQLVVNCAFIGNTRPPQTDGGAVSVNNQDEETARFVNCTFVHNSAGGFGGAIFVEDGSYYGTASVELVNSILWANTDVNGSGEESQVGALRTTASVSSTTAASKAGRAPGVASETSARNRSSSTCWDPTASAVRRMTTLGCVSAPPASTPAPTPPYHRTCRLTSMARIASSMATTTAPPLSTSAPGSTRSPPARKTSTATATWARAIWASCSPPTAISDGGDIDGGRRYGSSGSGPTPRRLRPALSLIGTCHEEADTLLRKDLG